MFLCLVSGCNSETRSPNIRVGFRNDLSGTDLAHGRYDFPDSDLALCLMYGASNLCGTSTDLGPVLALSGSYLRPGLWSLTIRLAESGSSARRLSETAFLVRIYAWNSHFSWDSDPPVILCVARDAHMSPKRSGTQRNKLLFYGFGPWHSFSEAQRQDASSSAAPEEEGATYASCSRVIQLFLPSWATLCSNAARTDRFRRSSKTVESRNWQTRNNRRERTGGGSYRKLTQRHFCVASSGDNDNKSPDRFMFLSCCRNCLRLPCNLPTPRSHKSTRGAQGSPERSRGRVQSDPNSNSTTTSTSTCLPASDPRRRAARHAWPESSRPRRSLSWSEEQPLYRPLSACRAGGLLRTFGRGRKVRTGAAPFEGFTGTRVDQVFPETGDWSERT